MPRRADSMNIFAKTGYFSFNSTSWSGSLRDSKMTAPQEAPSPRPGAPGSATALNLARSLNTTSKNHGSISRAGEILPDNIHKDNNLPFDLGNINEIIRNLAQKIEAQNSELEEALTNAEQVVSVEKLILDRLTGRTTANNTLIKLARQLPDAKNITSISATTFDLSIDFAGVEVWEGEASITAFHLEIHLEQIQISSSEGWNGADYNGLKQLDSHTIDTGRYLIGFLDMTTLTIYDKHTKLSTTIWGDPHVDLSDMEGARNGEFSDLKKSDILTTFHLLDGTDVVINAPDNGAIEYVDIFKEDAHARGFGLGLVHSIARGDTLFPEQFIGGGFFAGVDGDTGNLDTLRGKSDIVNAGGDGNDWYDEKGRLVWGGSSRAEN
jgi:hypothetical protein